MKFRAMDKIFNINRLLVIMGSFALVLLVVFWFWWGTKEITVSKEGSREGNMSIGQTSPITGQSCGNADIRPIAVMMPSDPVTRPLSGIAEADLVFEMPVTPGGVTRMMAVFQCSESGEIGSIRSAREDFITLAAGLNAVYVHWGGERQALEDLNRHIIDNIDAMKYENIYFFRKPGSRPPHNGFTDFDKLYLGVNNLKYDKENKFAGYPHNDDKPSASIINLAESVQINYPAPYDISWIYNKEKNTYSRIRGGKPETDKNTGSQAEASVIAVMKTSSSFSNKDYLNVRTTGTGEASVYQNGIKIPGRWEKDPGRLDGKLFFYDSDGKEIEFAPGRIWVEIVTN